MSSALIVKLTREQHRQLKREARERGLTVSDLVRWRALKVWPKSVAPDARVYDPDDVRVLP